MIIDAMTEYETKATKLYSNIIGKYETSEVTQIYAMWLATQDKTDYKLFDYKFHEIMKDKLKAK